MDKYKSNRRLDVERRCYAQRHTFHILRYSMYPVMTAVFLFMTLLPLVFYLHRWSFEGIPLSDVMHISFMALYMTIMS